MQNKPFSCAAAKATHIFNGAGAVVKPTLQKYTATQL